MKKNYLIDMFNQANNKNIKQIQKRFDAKIKELKNYQSLELANKNSKHYKYNYWYKIR